MVKDWVPGRAHIRPSPATMALKREAMGVANGRFGVNQWSIEFFGETWDTALSGRGHNVREFHFAPNIFPYAVPEGTRHYILWLPSSSAVDESLVNKYLDQAVAREGGGEQQGEGAIISLK